MAADWSKEVWRLCWVLLLSWVAGLVMANVWGAMLAGVLLLLGWHACQLNRFLTLVQNRKLGSSALALRGVWGELQAAAAQRDARHRAREQRLAGQLKEFRVSAAALPDAAVSLGNKLEIRWMNDAAVNLLGLNPVKDLGQPLVNLYRNPELARYLERREFRKAIEIGAAGRSERKLLIRMIPYAERRLLLLAQDVTERHRLEQVRKDFVANVSHELRTPLTVVSGFVENLQHDDELNRMRRLSKPLKLMAQQTTRMQKIVEELLYLARLEGGKAALEQSVAVDVPSMCAELSELSAASGADVPPISVAAEPRLGLLGDEPQLRSAFQNLVVNAINHTPTDGSIRIRWFRDANHKRLCFEVADSGIGIAAEHLPRLTERFYRVDTGRSRRHGGTGLGLAIVKHVLNHHDAQLVIESDPGEGSRFRCEFPVSRAVDVQESPTRVEQAC